MKIYQKKLKLDESRLKLIGLSLYGIKDINVNLICIDLHKSTKEMKHIVKVFLPENIDASLPNFFKGLDIVLFNKFDKESENLELAEEKAWSDYMDEEE